MISEKDISEKDIIEILEIIPDRGEGLTWGKYYRNIAKAIMDKINKEKTTLKKQIPTREQIIKILFSNIMGCGFGNKNLDAIKEIFNNIASEILGKEANKK